MIINPELKITLGIISSVLMILAYIPYLWDMYRGKTRPHIFSWLIWTLVGGITFFGQVSDKGGAGAWNTGTWALLCLIVFLGSFKTGTRDIRMLDWFCLLSCILGIALWAITKNALYTMILMCLIDTLAFLPTFRKAYHKPSEETLSVYYLTAVTIALGLLALENHTVITTLFPATLVLSNSLFVAMSLIRRAP